MGVYIVSLHVISEWIILDNTDINVRRLRVEDLESSHRVCERLHTPEITMSQILAFKRTLMIAQLEWNVSAGERSTTTERSHADLTDWLPQAPDDSSKQRWSETSLPVHLVTHADHALASS